MLPSPPSSIALLVPVQPNGLLLQLISYWLGGLGRQSVLLVLLVLLELLLELLLGLLLELELLLGLGQPRLLLTW